VKLFLTSDALVTKHSSNRPVSVPVQSYLLQIYSVFIFIIYYLLSDIHQSPGVFEAPIILSMIMPQTFIRELPDGQPQSAGASV